MSSIATLLLSASTMGGVVLLMTTGIEQFYNLKFQPKQKRGSERNDAIATRINHLNEKIKP